MKVWVKKPAVIHEAAAQSRGQSLWLEILIFFIVFLAGGVLPGNSHDHSDDRHIIFK